MFSLFPPEKIREGVPLNIEGIFNPWLKIVFEQKQEIERLNSIIEDLKKDKNE